MKYFFAANIADIDAITVTNNVVTEITLNTGANWYAFMPAKDSASYTETATISPENGTKFYEQTVAATFGKMENALRESIHELVDSEMIVIVKDNNEHMWLLGDKDDSVIVTASESATGQAWGDRNGATVTLTGKSRIPAMEVVPATSSNLEGDLADALDAVLTPQS